MEKRIVKKILVLGASGLIGHQIYLRLKKNKNFETYGVVNKRKFSSDLISINLLVNLKKLKKLIDNLNPDYIINCVGKLIDDSESYFHESIFLNSYLPNLLDDLSEKNFFKLIHISTDCVFSGNKKSSYFENDFKDGTSNYALSKNIGEIINNRNLTIRTSVVGPEIDFTGNELFNWFMKQKSSKINGYTNAIWSGITTIELAKAIEKIIKSEITGLYHFTNNSKISKFKLLELFSTYTQKNIEIVPCSKYYTDKSFVSTRNEFDYEFPTYEKMIIQMVGMMKDNYKLYSHYNI